MVSTRNTSLGLHAGTSQQWTNRNFMKAKVANQKAKKDEKSQSQKISEKTVHAIHNFATQGHQWTYEAGFLTTEKDWTKLFLSQYSNTIKSKTGAKLKARSLMKEFSRVKSGSRSHQINALQILNRITFCLLDNGLDVLTVAKFRLSFVLTKDEDIFRKEKYFAIWLKDYSGGVRLNSWIADIVKENTGIHITVTEKILNFLATEETLVLSHFFASVETEDNPVATCDDFSLKKGLEEKPKCTRIWIPVYIHPHYKRWGRYLPSRLVGIRQGFTHSCLAEIDLITLKMDLVDSNNSYTKDRLQSGGSHSELIYHDVLSAIKDSFYRVTNKRVTLKTKFTKCPDLEGPPGPINECSLWILYFCYCRGTGLSINHKGFQKQIVRKEFRRLLLDLLNSAH